MFIELHILQNFAPANLNRDDTGSPKECEFGGYRRARISSQCLKRAMRTAFQEMNLIEPKHLAARTKRLLERLAADLVTKREREGASTTPEQAAAVAQVALGGLKLKIKDDQKTEYLLFLGQQEIDGIERVCLDRWDDLLKVAPPVSEADVAKTARQQKSDSMAALPSAIIKQLEEALRRGSAADLALFGRMLADKPELNVEAASQVAHAISTNKVSPEFDYYTAVDDLKPDDTAGADMIGTVEYNSSCFYRYLNVDVAELRKNLGGDEALTRATVQAVITAAVKAIPTGKQNSFAAHNPPSSIFAVARKSGAWSLANAFIEPVRADAGHDLVAKSTSALHTYWAKLVRMYGDDGIVGAWRCQLDGDGAAIEGVTTLTSLAELTASIVGAVAPVGATA